MQIIAEDEQQTAKAAHEMAQTLDSQEIICLYGPLGAGKTVFTRALIRALTGDNTLEIPSPTFTLVQTYESNKGPIWHYDLYRLKDSEEIYELGWEESLIEGFTIIEWPERLGALLPKRRTDIHFTTDENNPNKRVIEIARHET